MAIDTQLPLHSHTQTFLSEMKQALEQEQKRLLSELSKFAVKDPHTEGNYNALIPQYGDEEDDNAREVAEFTANKPLEIALENTLRDITSGLQRIEEGTYGVCKYCEQTIDEKRLRARPTSSSCVSCKKTITQEV